MAHRTSEGGSGGAEIEEVLDDNIGVAPAGTGTASASNGDGDDVYVAVGKGSSSMEALSWALKHAVKPGSFVYLVHVFPCVHLIPTPLGMLQKDQVNAEQVENYMHQERLKRREILHKFLNQCQISRVHFDTCLVESDDIVKAVAELITVLHIKRLIVGISKSNLRRLNRGSCKAVQIQKSAPGYCEIKIICSGKEVVAAPAHSPSPSLTPVSPCNDNNTQGETVEQAQQKVTCRCLNVKFL